MQEKIRKSGKGKEKMRENGKNKKGKEEMRNVRRKRTEKAGDR